MHGQDVPGGPVGGAAMSRVVGPAPVFAQAGQPVVYVLGGAGDAEGECVAAAGRFEVVADRLAHKGTSGCDREKRQRFRSALGLV